MELPIDLIPNVTKSKSDQMLLYAILDMSSSIDALALFVLRQYADSYSGDVNDLLDEFNEVRTGCHRSTITNLLRRFETE